MVQRFSKHEKQKNKFSEKSFIDFLDQHAGELGDDDINCNDLDSILVYFL